jgi:LPS export ABC transporter protein LptC
MIKPEIIKYLQKARKLIPGILLPAILLQACSNDPKEIDALTGKHQLTEDIAHNVTIIYSENGTPKVRIYGTEFIRNEFVKPSYTDIRKGIKIEFFDDSLRLQSTLTAKYARFYDEKRTVLIRDSIIIKTKKQEEIRTEELVWNQNIKKIYNEKPVTIITPTQTMYGDALDAEEDLSIYQIKNLRGSLEVDKSTIPQ